MATARSVIARATLALSLLSLACQSPALLRTARTLPPGSSDWSLSFNVTHLSTNVAGESGSATFGL